MFFLRAPSDQQIRRFISSQGEQPFSYPEVGASRHGDVERVEGYTIDRHRVKLGVGDNTFERAVDALRQWRHFDLGWVRIVPPEIPIEIGVTVAVLAKLFAFWSLNACRIVYVIDEDAPIKRFGFAYGTLRDHAERGEERFTIEWQGNDDSVWYDILAFSQPNLLAKLGYPLTRRLQKKFARDSLAAMVKTVSE